MLREFALSPHLFDEAHFDADDDRWLKNLGDFIRVAKPSDQAHFIVVSDLRAGEWFKVVDQNINKASTDRKTALLSLKGKLQEMLVTRPDCLAAAATEDEWLHEASASRSTVAIDRVVGSSKWDNPKKLAGVKVLDDVGLVNFWPDMAPSRCPKTELADQLSVLVPLTTHSEYIGFSSAQLDIHGSKDLAFVIGMIRQARSRHPGYSTFTQLDLHTKGGGIADAQRQLQADRMYNEIKQKLGRPLPNVRIFFWPLLVERVLLAGGVSAGAAPNVRWVTAMTHVVRPTLDPPDGDPPTWTMLPPKPAGKWITRFYAASAKPLAKSPHVYARIP